MKTWSTYDGFDILGVINESGNIFITDALSFTFCNPIKKCSVPIITFEYIKKQNAILIVTKDGQVIKYKLNNNSRALCNFQKD